MNQVNKVLIIDDDETSRFLIKRVFKRIEIEADILTANNGLEALAIVNEVCQQEQCPKLILLDINMPIMDGFEFLEALQKSANLSRAAIKIVLLSSSTHQLDLARARKYPVVDCIEKPLTLEKLSKFM